VVSYGEVVQATLGGGGQRLVEALLIISQTGEPLGCKHCRHPLVVASRDPFSLHSPEVELPARDPDHVFPPGVHHPRKQHHRCIGCMPA